MPLSRSEIVARLAELEAAIRPRESLPAFIGRVSPKIGSEVPRHLRRLIYLLEASRRRPVRCLVSMPPRHGKTTSFAHAIAWRCRLDPASLNFYVAFGDTLAVATSRSSRRLAARGGVTFGGKAGEHEWRTPQDGGLVATSVGGSITGRGCNGGLIVADDLTKGRAEAESKPKRDRVWDYFREDMMSRVEAGASVFVCQTRWHEDDVIGRLQKDPLGEEWEEIRLPAVAGPDGKAVDERLVEGVALWPERYPLATLAKARARGEYGWWSLYQQEPRPKGGRLFGEPSRFQWDGKWRPNWRGVIAVDPATTAKTKADHSAIAVCAMEGYGERSEMYVLDMVRVQVEGPALVRLMRDKQRRYRLMLAVEAAGGGFKHLPQFMRDMDPTLRILEITTGGLDKFARAQPLSAAWNGTPDAEGNIRQRVHVPIDAPWADVFLEEMRIFSGVDDAHDDQVDAVVHAWNTLYREKPSRAGHGARRADWMPFG